MRNLRRYIYENDRIKNVCAVNHVETASFDWVSDGIYRFYLRPYDIRNKCYYEKYSKTIGGGYRGYASQLMAYRYKIGSLSVYADNRVCEISIVRYLMGATLVVKEKRDGIWVVC